MSFRGFPPRVRPVHLALFVLFASLALVTAPIRSIAQSSPQPSPKSSPQPSPKSSPQPSPKSSPKPPEVNVPIAPSPQKSMDWWVPSILGASVVGAGAGGALLLRRSQQPVLQTSEPSSPPSEAPSPPAIDSTIEPNSIPRDLSSAPQPEPTHSEQMTGDPTPPSASLPSAAIATQTIRMAKPSVMDVLVHNLRNGDPNQRQRAIWELGQRGDSRAVQPLVDLLLDSDSRQRGLVLSALSEISTRTLKPVSRALAISLQDENADVRKNAIRDLTRVYDLLANVSQLLQSACEDSDVEVQETAKWALGQINRIKAPLIEPGPTRSVSRPETLN